MWPVWLKVDKAKTVCSRDDGFRTSEEIRNAHLRAIPRTKRFRPEEM